MAWIAYGYSDRSLSARIRKTTHLSWAVGPVCMSLTGRRLRGAYLSDTLSICIIDCRRCLASGTVRGILTSIERLAQAARNN